MQWLPTHQQRWHPLVQRERPQLRGKVLQLAPGEGGLKAGGLQALGCLLLYEGEGKMGAGA